MSNKIKLLLAVFLLVVGFGRFAMAETRPMIIGGGGVTGDVDLTVVNSTLATLSTNKADKTAVYLKTDIDTALSAKLDKADRICATGFVLKGITSAGTAECVAASAASLPTGSDGQVLGYDANGDPVAVTPKELAFSATDFSQATVGNVTTVSLAGSGGGTLSVTESATDPAYDTMTTGQLIASKSSGDLFYKSSTGGYTFAGVYVVDPATYALTFTLSGVSGADKLTINGTDYTAGTTISGLSGDVAVTGTLGSSTALACTGTGISGSGLSYLASMTEARSMECEFSGVSVFPPETLTLLDNFNRSTGVIGSDWTTVTNESAISITLNTRAYGSTELKRLGVLYNAITPGNDQCVSVLVNPYSIHTGGAFLRASTTSESGYLGVVEGANIIIKKMVNGTMTSLSTPTASTWGDYDKLTFCAIGTSPTALTIYHNDVLVSTYNDASNTFTSGAVGMFIYGATKMDDFSVATQ